MAHWIRRSPEWSRTSLPSAGLLQFCRKRVTSFCSCLFRRVIPSWRDCVLDLGYAIRSQIASFLGNPGCPFCIIRRLNFQFKSIVAKKLYDVNFDDWSNHCSSWNRCIRSGSWVCQRKCMLSENSRHTGVKSPKTSSTSEVVL